MLYPSDSVYDPVRKKLTNGKTALHLAVKNGHFKVVELLVNFIATDVNAKDKCDRTCIYLAVRGGYVDITKLLLNHIKTDPNVQVPINDHYTSLHVALENKDIEMAIALLNHSDINLNIKETFRKFTPFHMAVKVSLSPVVEKMLEHPETDLNTMNKFSETPLYTCAIENGNINMVEMLLKAGVKIHEAVFRKLTSANVAVSENYSNILRMITDYVRGNIKRGENLDISLNEDLLAASRSGNLQRVREILQQSGIDINFVDRNGNNCLHLAAENGHVEIVRWLLKRSDIEVNAKNKDYSKYIYPIHYGDDPNRTEVTDGKSPLFCAVMRGQLEVVRLLVSHYKIDVNAKDKYHKTCLHLAAIKGYIKIVEILLRHPKIDVNARYTCYDHITPLHIAIEKNRLEIVEPLLGHRDIDVNIKERLYEYTPLHMAGNHGYASILRRLLTHPKIEVNIKSKSCQTALQLSMENKQELCAQILLNTRLPACN